MPDVLTAGAILRRSLRRNRGRMAGAIALITSWQVCEALVPVAIGITVERAVATGSRRGRSSSARWGSWCCSRC